MYRFSQILAVLSICICLLHNAGAFVPLATKINVIEPSRHQQRQDQQVASRLHGSVIDLDDSNFPKLVNGEESVLLIDACATWCGPCRLIEPVMEHCAHEYDGLLTVGRFDVESENNDIKVELIVQGVMPRSLPSLILFKGNKAVWKRSGVISKEELKEALKENGVSLQAGPTEPQKKQAGFIGFRSEVDDYMLSQV